MENQPTQGFHPGSEWLFLKAYCGTRMADTVISAFHSAVFAPLLEQKAADKWFFVRYTDPDFHLRIRVRLTTKDFTLFFNLFNDFISPLLESSAVHDISFHTYRRELERYGPAHIELAESLFYYDSIFITAMLEHIRGEAGEQYRWMTALALVDAYLDQFRFPPEHRASFSRMMMESMYAKLGVDKQLKIQIDRKYRAAAATVSHILEGRWEPEKYPEAVRELLRHRAMHTSPVTDTFLRSPDFSDDIAFSLVHMALNKLFRAKPNQQEAVIYTFLHKYYKSALARSRQSVTFS